MSSTDAIVIVGAGQAGGRAAHTLRRSGYAGKVVLIGAEAYRPYERPELSKAILMGNEPAPDVFLFSEDFYVENEIHLLTNTHVVEVNNVTHHVILSTGEAIPFTKLVLATGGRVRELPIAPMGMPGVFYLRTLADAVSLRDALRPQRRLIVIGAGFLGLEIACAAARSGLLVTVVERAPHILDRVAAPEVSENIEAFYRRRQVDIRTSETVAEISYGECIEGVRLSNGGWLACDLLVVAVGIVPNIELADGIGAHIDNGIYVDEFGRTTIENIYAIGDVANHPNATLECRLRLESWQNAQNQAISVARGLCEVTPSPYREIPWFWSNQFDRNIQMVGIANHCDCTVLRSFPNTEDAIFFHLRDGILIGATTFNLGREIRFLRKLIEARIPIAESDCMNSAIKLDSIHAQR